VYVCIHAKYVKCMNLEGGGERWSKAKHVVGLGAPPDIVTAGRIENIEKGLDVGVVGSFNLSLRLEDIDSN
jgi:hypothetical protein